MRNVRNRIKRFLRSKRPLPGDPWADWARELLAMWDLRAWYLQDPPTTPEAFLREAQIPNVRTLHRYREALRVLEELEAAGANAGIVSRVPYTYVFRLHPFLGNPEVLRQALAALSRGEKEFVTFSKKHEREVRINREKRRREARRAAKEQA